MYRLKNLNRISKIFLYLVSMSCLIWICFSGEINLTPMNFLNKRVDTAQKNIEINNSKWKAIVKNLYDESLKKADLLKMSPMLTSVKNTTNSLNDTYLCTLNDNDTINILYKSNDEFRKILKNASSNFDKPTKNDMVNSCWNLMNCVLSWYERSKIVDTVSYCEMIVNDFYLAEYRTNYNSNALTKRNEWLDAFWNKSLNDSSYDILNDVYILARILFDSPQEPEETLFYEMPDVSTTVNNIDTYTDIINIIKNRFSPYITPETWSNSGWPGDDNGWSNWWDGTSNQNPENGVVVNWYLDEEFLENSATITSNGGSSNWYDYLGQNEKCLNIEPSSDPENPWWNSQGNPENPWWGSQWNPENPWWGSQWNSEPNPGVNIPELSWDEEALSCFASCNDVPCSATSCDRLACYMQCLCISYESPQLRPIISWMFTDDMINPGMWPIFRLKFCLQPVQDGKLTTSKKTYNLESIIREINTVIQNLRNSWELMLNKKTREFLDAGFQKNNFSKQISFSIDGFSKIPETNQSEKQKKEDQENLNIALMEYILWFEKDPTVESAWRDKYLVKWWKQNWWSISSSQSQDQVGATRSYINNSSFISSLQSEHLTDMWFQLSEFLDANINFWISVKESLNSVNNVAKALLDKK